MKIEVSAGLVSLEAQRTPISLLLPAPRCHLHPSACGAPSPSSKLMAPTSGSVLMSSLPSSDPPSSLLQDSQGPELHSGSWITDNPQ